MQSGWLQVPTEFALGTLRLSTGRYTTKEDIDKALQLIIAGLERQNNDRH